MQRWVRIFAALVVAEALVGCALFAPKPPPPLPAPDARIAVAQYAGNVLSGPLQSNIDNVKAAKAWRVSARVFAVQSLPTDASFASIGPQARLVIGLDSATLFAPSSRLVQSTRARPLNRDDDIETLLGLRSRWIEMRPLQGAVIPGSTVSFEIAVGTDAPLTASLARRKFTLAVSRTPDEDGYELTLVSDSLLFPSLNCGQETIIVKRSMANGADRLALTLPMQFPDSLVAGLVIDLAVDEKAADAPTIAAMKDQIGATSALVAAGNLRPSPSSADAAITAAVEAICAGNSQRGMLIFLADDTGAALAASVILVCDDKALDLILGQLRPRLANLPTRDRTSVGWMLDRATIKAIASIRQEDSPATLPPVLGALASFAGDAGRQLDVLQSLADQSAGSADLYARITAEQFIALEDNSPSVRVRAYDWLVRRGIAPPGFDPLGLAHDRRSALDKFTESSAHPGNPVVGK